MNGPALLAACEQLDWQACLAYADWLEERGENSSFYRRLSPLVRLASSVSHYRYPGTYVESRTGISIEKAVWVGSIVLKIYPPRVWRHFHYHTPWGVERKNRTIFLACVQALEEYDLRCLREEVWLLHGGTLIVHDIDKQKLLYWKRKRPDGRT